MDCSAANSWLWLCNCGGHSKDATLQFIEQDEISGRDVSRAHQLEELLQELFALHDLNSNGFLEEMELVELNQKISILHYGTQADQEAVRVKYVDLFRSKLDPDGKPVPYDIFRRYMQGVMHEFEPRDELAQEMILEQFVEEARSARVAICQRLIGPADLGWSRPKLSNAVSLHGSRSVGVARSLPSVVDMCSPGRSSRTNLQSCQPLSPTRSPKQIVLGNLGPNAGTFQGPIPVRIPAASSM